jgi:spore maturation protein CgeB
VSDDEYLRISREAVVTIGVSRVSTTKASDRKPIVYSRLRDVEAPMLGACYLTEWTEDVAALYELGTEIETYRTAEELAAKLRDLQRDPMRRSAMRRLAQRRALDEHQIPRTLGKIQSLLGLPVAA